MKCTEVLQNVSRVIEPWENFSARVVTMVVCIRAAMMFFLLHLLCCDILVS